MKTISAVMDLLPASIIALCSPILAIIFTILSPVLTPLTTLMPYLLNVLRDLDKLVVQLLQLLNGIPALTNSFFVLRLISRCIPLPFTTTIGCLNTLYDLIKRVTALPMSLPGIVPLYQLFNLLLFPNGIINLILSPCYTGIFTIGSIIKGIAEVLTIPELIQIAMLILALPILLISFILQIPSRIFNNMKMLCVSIIALDAEEPEVGEPLEPDNSTLGLSGFGGWGAGASTEEPLETQGRNNPADGAEKGSDKDQDGEESNKSFDFESFIRGAFGDSVADFLSSKAIEIAPMVSGQLIREYMDGNMSATDLFKLMLLNNIYFTQGKAGLERYSNLTNITFEIVTGEVEGEITGMLVIHAIEKATGEVVEIPMPVELVKKLVKREYENKEEFLGDITHFLITAGVPPAAIIFAAWELGPAIVEAVTGQDPSYYITDQPTRREYSDLLKKRYFLKRHVNDTFMHVDPEYMKNEKDQEVMLKTAEKGGHAGIYVVEVGERSLWPAKGSISYITITFYDLEGNSVSWTDNVDEKANGVWCDGRYIKEPTSELYRVIGMHPVYGKIRESPYTIEITEGTPQDWTTTGGTISSSKGSGAYIPIDDSSDNAVLDIISEWEEKGYITREEAEALIDLYTGVELKEETVKELGKKIEEIEEIRIKEEGMPEGKNEL